MSVPVTLESLTRAMQYAPFHVEEVRMGPSEYAGLMKSSRQMLDVSTDVHSIRSGVMAHIHGARVQVHRSGPQDRVVLAAEGRRAEWCLVHDSVECDADECVARQVLES